MRACRARSPGAPSGRTGGPAALSPEQVRDKVLAFITRPRSTVPVLREEGAADLLLEDGRYSIEPRQGKVLLEAWDDTRSVVRRVLDIRRESEDELVLVCRQFGAGETIVRIAASSKSTAKLQKEAARGAFASRLRRLLAQAFPLWRLERLTVERDLQRSFSVQVARATIARGSAAWAVAGCAEEEGETAAGCALAQGLAWLDHERRAEMPDGGGMSVHRHRVMAGLKLFLPESYVETTAHRLRFLNREMAAFELYAFNETDEVRPVGETEHANLATDLPHPLPTITADPADVELLRRLCRTPGAELVPKAGGGAAVHILGLEFAHADSSGALFGVARGFAGAAAGTTPAAGLASGWQPLNVYSMPEAAGLAAEIYRYRSAETPDKHHRYFTAQPERWLETMLLHDISVLSSELDARYVYSQVPALLGGQRGIIDLLSVTCSGRLVVLELKASPDPNLVLQALDYWMRVKWHLDRGEFRRLGYFAGKELAPDPPLLWLVAPAYEFHPLTDVVLRYLSPVVPVRRIGLNYEWRQGVKVVTR